jgi:hypothetical protein
VAVYNNEGAKDYTTIPNAVKATCEGIWAAFLTSRIKYRRKVT